MNPVIVQILLTRFLSSNKTVTTCEFTWLRSFTFLERMKNHSFINASSPFPFPKNLARVNYFCDSSVSTTLAKMCAILGQLHATVAINGDKSTTYRALLERPEEIGNFTVKTL